MQPTLCDGEYVLVRKQATPNPGDIVLCTHPFKKNVRLLKRAATIDSDGVFVLGDAPSQSTDSRSFGPLPRTHIIGVVTSKMS